MEKAETDRSYGIVLATIGFIFFFGIGLTVLIAARHIQIGHVILAGICMFLGTIMYPWQILDALGREYLLEDKSVIYKSGILTRYEADIPYTSIKGVSIKQGILQRIMGCADIRITAPGLQDPHTVSSTETNSMCLRSVKNYQEVGDALRNYMKSGSIA